MAQVAVADVAAIVALPLVHAAVEGRRERRSAGSPSRPRRSRSSAPRTSCATIPRSTASARSRRSSIWALDLRLALLSLFVLAWIAVRSGTSILIAGFAVGLVVAVIGGPKRLSTQVTGIAAGFFVPLFFVTLGAKLDLRAVVEKPSILELTALLIVANVAVHIVGAAAHPPAAARGARRHGPARAAGRRRHARPAGARDQLGPGWSDPDRGAGHDRSLPGGHRVAHAHEDRQPPRRPAPARP